MQRLRINLGRGRASAPAPVGDRLSPSRLRRETGDENATGFLQRRATDLRIPSVSLVGAAKIRALRLFDK